jgi:arylsulfatase A-like enzyme
MQQQQPMNPMPAVESPRSVLRLALWFGLLTGLGEVALLALRKLALNRIVFAGIDVVWMAPVADVALFVAAAVALIAARAVLPRRIPVPTVLLLTALSVFTLLLIFDALYRPAVAVLGLGVGTVALRIVHRWPGVFERLVGRTLLPMAAAIALAAGALQLWAARDGRGDVGATARAGAPDILLLVLDTVRARNLGIYAYDRPTTPELGRWLRDGLRFEHSLATAPWTLPSHATMFTGRFPHELSADWLVPLDRAQPTLAEALARQGYATAGFVGNTAYCSYETGLARGFAHYEDYPVSVAQVVFSSALGRYLAGSRFVRRQLLRKSAEDVNGSFLRWLDGRTDARPYFAFLNYLDAHDPYQPPPPFDGRFSGPGATRLVETLHGDLAAGPWTPELRQAAIDKYDESIAYLDHQLGQLFAALQARGRWERTLVVVTSDHGEEFGEHGVYFHGNSLYRASLEVPLLLRYPGVVPAGQAIVVPVSLRDLAATVLELAGAPAELPGRSLARYPSLTVGGHMEGVELGLG